jgi:hypothetical protein
MNKPTAIMYTDNPKTNYAFCKPGHRLVKPQTINEEHIDYTVPRTVGAIKKGHTQDLPISFFNIAEGDVEAGKIWYQNKFPKLPDDFAYLLSRYNFGDLKYATKKSLKNARKKSVKKTGKKEDVTKGYNVKINRVPTVISFD